MRRILFAAFFALLLLGQHSRAQSVSGGCFYMGGPILDSWGCSTVVVYQISSVSSRVSGRTGISALLSGPDVEASGEVTGAPFASASIPCEFLGFGLSGAPLSFGGNAAPGVYFLTVKFTACGPPPYNTYGPWIGYVTVVVLPPDPATIPPPPTCGALLIDPVKSGLLQGPAVTSNEGSILNPNPLMPPVFVQGVSADGVTEAIVAVATANLGDSVQLNLINDANTPSSSSAQDGGLTTLGGSVSSLSNSVGITADTSTSIGPTAFAIYVAPTNYARGSQNFPQDNTTVQRSVSLQTICLTSGGSPSSPTDTPVTIARPPVVLVHGMWSDATAWNSFAPTPPGSPEAQLWSLLTPTSGFSPGAPLFKSDYSACVAVGSTTPAFSGLSCRNQPSQVSGNALGFQFNAPIVLQQISDEISTYASNIDVAAVQADVIAHSMGGNITRYMPLLDQTSLQAGQPPVFLTSNTYGQGPIEKLITIGTPHLGSPIAIDLLPSGQTDLNACVRRRLADNANPSLQTATVSGTAWPGAVGDLSGDGRDTNGASAALQAVQNSQGSQPFPMAYISATTSSANLAGLNCTNPFCKSNQLYAACYLWPGTSDPLAGDLTQNNWNNVFNNLANDAVVPLTSQLNGASSPTGTIPTIQGDIHSQGFLSLDFFGPFELEDNVIAIEAVDLLNESKGGTDFQY